jgi:hypothetical protein
VGSVDQPVKQMASTVAEDIINRIGGTPFHKAVDRLCVAVIGLLPNIPTEQAAELGKALGDLQEASLSQTTSTASATIVAAAGGLRGEVAALRDECRRNHEAIMARFDEHLGAHEAGK